MKYNAKYKRWVTKGGLVYRFDDKNDRLVLCKLSVLNTGYLAITVKKPKTTLALVHRLVFETFIGKIPQGYEIDHINTIRDDNRLENLRVVTRRENLNNPLTRKHISDSRKGKVPHNKGKTRSEFGGKFRDHYGKTRIDDVKLYDKEQKWYRKHNNLCRWEMNENAHE